MTLFNLPNSWNILQKYIHKFIYVDWILNYGIDYNIKNLINIIHNSPNSYLIHGNSNSSSLLIIKTKKNFL